MSNHNAMIGLYITAITAFFIAGAAGVADGKGTAIINNNGSLSINVENEDPTTLFTDLSKEANLDVQGVDVIPRESITVRFENLSVDEGIKVVMRAMSVDNYAIFYRKGPDSTMVVSSIAFIGGEENINASALSSAGPKKEPFKAPKPKSINRAKSRGITAAEPKTKQSRRTRRVDLSSQAGNVRGEKDNSFRRHSLVNPMMNRDKGEQQKALNELMQNLDPEERAHMEEAIEPFFNHMDEVDPELGGRLMEMMEGLDFGE